MTDTITMLWDDELVIMTPDAFERLPEYSMSVPTGAFPGKRWKRHQPYNVPPEEGEWWMGEYVVCEDDESMVETKWRLIEVVDQ